VQGVLVDGHEPLDVVGDIADSQAQHLLSRVPAVGLARLLQAAATAQVGIQHLDEQVQGTAVTVVERRAGHPGAAGQIGNGDLRDGPPRGELHDRLRKSELRSRDARIGAICHRFVLL
jgi:hypothetical protein